MHHGKPSHRTSDGPSLAVALSLILSRTPVIRLLAPPTPLLDLAPLRDHWFAVDAQGPREGSLQQRVLLTVRSGLRGFAVPVARLRFPIPLCDTLGCVHPQHESFHRGLLSLRGPLVLLTPHAGHRSSCLSLCFMYALCYMRFSVRCHTLLPIMMTSSLVVVTCFAMSFALRSGATARLILDASLSLLHCTRAAVPTLSNCARSRLSAACGYPSSLFS